MLAEFLKFFAVSLVVYRLDSEVNHSCFPLLAATPKRFTGGNPVLRISPRLTPSVVGSQSSSSSSAPIRGRASLSRSRVNCLLTRGRARIARDPMRMKKRYRIPTTLYTQIILRSILFYVYFAT